VANRILPEFQDFLISRSLAPARNAPFYAHWVSNFLAFSNRNQDLGPDLRAQKFLQKKIADWQVRQVADAVILYVEKYLKRSLQQLTPQAEDSTTKSTEPQVSIHWKQALEESKNAIRLRHFSLSTEKTYLGWIARFKTFLKDRDPHLLEVNDMKKYLTHLALHGRVSASTQNKDFQNK